YRTQARRPSARVSTPPGTTRVRILLSATINGRDNARDALTTRPPRDGAGAATTAQLHRDSPPARGLELPLSGGAPMPMVAAFDASPEPLRGAPSDRRRP